MTTTIDQLRACLEHALKQPFAVSTYFSSTSLNTAAPIRPMIVVPQEVFEDALTLLERLEAEEADELHHKAEWLAAQDYARKQGWLDTPPTAEERGDKQ